MSSDYSIYRNLVSQLMRGEERLPSLPSLTMQIRSALGNSHTSMAALERLIGRDPALSALLVKCASSPLYRQGRQAQGLKEVIQLLGIKLVSSITMAHSLKSLFTLSSPAYKRLFVEAWERQVLKASTCSVIASRTGRIDPEYALLASLLSEVGSLVVLSAFSEDTQPPTADEYYRLCRDFSKSLGVILLMRWAVEGEYIEIIRQVGQWEASPGAQLQPIDIVNLALYHAIRERDPDAGLPPLTEVAAYRKLPPPLRALNERGGLQLIDDSHEAIQSVAASFR
jgi:HD-like signal output (HDOD) protein